MKNYRKSDYALNKNKKGIVYRNADGSILEITFEKIAQGDPLFTYADFQRLKAFSDQIYLEQVRKENRESYHVRASLDETRDTEWLTTSPLEEQLFGTNERMPSMASVKKLAKQHSTEAQRRRFFMSLAGLSTVKIAEIEGCNQNAAWKSIEQAKKILKKFLKRVVEPP